MVCLAAPKRRAMVPCPTNGRHSINLNSGLVRVMLIVFSG